MTRKKNVYRFVRLGKRQLGTWVNIKCSKNEDSMVLLKENQI